MEGLAHFDGVAHEHFRELLQRLPEDGTTAEHTIQDLMLQRDAKERRLACKLHRSITGGHGSPITNAADLAIPVITCGHSL